MQILSILAGVFGNARLLLAVLLLLGGSLAGWWTRGIFDEGITERKLALQAAALTELCKKNQKITSEVESDQIKEIRRLSARLVELKRMQPNEHCVPVARSTCECDGTTTKPKPSGANGLLASNLLEYAAVAEGYRLQLVGCQSFIKKVWEANASP